MARTPVVARERIPEDQRATFDELVGLRGGVPTSGPSSVMLNAPEVAKLALGLALYLRTDTSLVPRIRELGMLVAARENDCQFIWNAHAPAGRRAGLRDDIVDALRTGKELPALAPDEAAVVNYGREFFRDPPDQPNNLRCGAGSVWSSWTTELTNLLGCYAMLAFNVNAFGVELPPERTEEALPI